MTGIIPDFRIRELSDVKPGDLIPNPGMPEGTEFDAEEWHPLIEPFNEENLCPAGYDLTLDQIEVRGPTWCLVSTKETVCIPPNVLAEVKLRSSLIRQGWRIEDGYIDPGFHGQLTFALHRPLLQDELDILGRGGVLPNAKTETRLVLEDWKNDSRQRGRFCQIVFHRLEEPCETCYVGRSGNYQGSRGVTGSVE